MTEVRISPQLIASAAARRSVRGDTFGTRRLAQRIATRAEDIAKRQASGGMFMRRTGALERSVVAFVEPDPRRPLQGFRVVLGTTVEHGGYLEHGTEGHFIYPNKPGGFLQSYPNHPPNRSPLERRVYDGLWHPGNQPFRWLRRSLNIAVRNSRVGTRSGV
jgi:hypothetical protein